MREIYQKLYDNHDYANTSENAVKGMIKLFNKWLHGKIIDLGAGRGLYVKELRAQGYVIDGMDFTCTDNDIIIRDITEHLDLSGYDTAICLDVFEHLHDMQVIRVLKNMQLTKWQVIHINNQPFEMAGHTLHVNIKPFDAWRQLIGKYLTICESPYESKMDSMIFCKYER